MSMLFACHYRHADPVITSQKTYFNAIASNDIPLGPPQEGDWRFTHKETAQTFEAYKAARPVKTTATRSVIYLLPVGEFTPLQEKVLEATREYTAIFFQLKTVLLPAHSDDSFPSNTFRQRDDGHIQLLASYILHNLLKGKTPDNGIALMAISARDLYPQSDWNYVFGLASYAERVGVSSIYRLQNETTLDATNYLLCLKRLNSIASHEIGHMFSLHHCLHARCAMNGTNNLEETDRAPNRICSECQKKLYWNLRYDNQKRLQELVDYCRQHQLQRDLGLLQKDLDATR
ncbi:Zn-dependent protease [Chitinophaga sp. G-6-1-13]|uniref:Zn-dependent protease n=1 Tax=Chitinophaga fulva TaxID=2728842 RepID=A0A848GJM6_9BACT|nr:archaemetzincin [Chitinophaga fulva]NML37242.1 Zn-dependent protease [Chitinophaga fulva]